MVRECKNSKKNKTIEKRFYAATDGFVESLLLHVKKCIACKEKRECFDRAENEIIVPEKIIVMGLLPPWLAAFGQKVSATITKKFEITPAEMQIFSRGQMPATVDKPLVKKMN